MLGTLELTDDGRYALRFERTYPHPPAKVWRALTETRHLREGSCRCSTTTAPGSTSPTGPS
jgi:uncharacterized protein YndB with AHSA1/START domain